VKKGNWKPRVSWNASGKGDGWHKHASRARVQWSLSLDSMLHLLDFCPKWHACLPSPLSIMAQSSTKTSSIWRKSKSDTLKII
jgi:hypothetical protein